MTMKQEVTNFARFYGLLKEIPVSDKETLKEQLVSSFTNQRTTSLREMSKNEYNALCAELEKQYDHKKAKEMELQELRRHRSNVLHQLQLFGIDTTDWNGINKFCENKKIAGKPFRYLSVEELENLYRKMKMIIKKQ